MCASRPPWKSKPRKALLIYDVPGWAWHRRAQDLQTFAPDGIHVTIVSDAELDKLCRRNNEFPNQFDAIFALNWPGCNIHFLRGPAKRLVSLSTSSGLLYDAVDENNWDSWIYTPSRCESRARGRMPQFDAMIAVNEEIAAKARSFNPNTYRIPSPVNTDFYEYRSIVRRPDGRLRVGWCANPLGKKTVKGYKEVLEPLMALNIPGIDWQVNTKNYKTALTREEMKLWYRDIDVFLCTSINDGTPSPIFEAASTGRIIMSTDVGCVKDWALPHDMGLIVPRYHNQDTADARIVELGVILKRLRDTTFRKLNSMSQHLRESVEQTLSYNVLAPEYFKVIMGDGSDATNPDSS